MKIGASLSSTVALRAVGAWANIVVSRPAKGDRPKDWSYAPRTAKSTARRKVVVYKGMDAMWAMSRASMGSLMVEARQQGHSFSYVPELCNVS